MAGQKEFFHRPRSLIFLLGILSLVTGCRENKQAQLRVMTWTDYFREEAVAEFEKEQNVKVILDYFSSNEELLAKVQANIEAGGKGYDLILPSDYMEPAMVRLQLLSPFDKLKLTFLSDFDSKFLKPAYDPELAYGVPFAYGTTGIAINTKLLPKVDPNKGLSWKDFFENPEFKGKVTLLNDMREVFQAALLAQGKHWSQATEEDLRNAFEYLKKNKAQIKIFTEETVPVMTHDECALCQSYSGDAYRTGASKPELKFIVPKDGATVWTDNFAIPKNGGNAPLAYAFINKMMTTTSAADFTNLRYFATPNLKSKANVSPAIRQNIGIYPDANTFRRLHFMSERTDLLKLADRLWTELKSQ